ncbi:MAG: lipoprotein [Betaproteobacteria bacterium]|nr:lipoprotein [Betaproteobacteria bacterium]
MRKPLLFAFCAVAILSGCGGGDNTVPTPAAAAPPAVTSAVPASASLSVDGFIAYLKALVVAAADTLEPVDVSAVTPPTSDTTEPTPVQ